MFAGIIEHVEPILATDKRGRNVRVRVQRPSGWRMKPGESISVNGICSTVVSHGRGYFDVEYIPETLKKTTAGSFVKGSKVNLERSLKVGASVDGHFVFGHVDSRAEVRGVENDGVYEIDIEIPSLIRSYVVPLGSLAVNGASLTIARVRGSVATFALIPHTRKHTNLGSLKKGDMVNVEADMMARYAIAAVAPGGRPREIKSRRRL